MPRLRLVLPPVLVLALAGAPAADAVRPARDCGTVTVGEKRYRVKEDGVPCADARSGATRWMKRDVAPRGWTCRDFADERRRVRFTCEKGRRVFLAVRL
jgi:hypothetical protein